jgi:hypothetical protein
VVSDCSFEVLCRLWVSGTRVRSRRVYAPGRSLMVVRLAVGVAGGAWFVAAVVVRRARARE